MTVEVIQADRDVAAKWMLVASGAVAMREGLKDDHELVRDFARHRLSTTTRVDATDGERAWRVPRAFIDAILHGDDEHRLWLREAADCWNNGRPVPLARSRQPAAEADALPDPTKLSPETIEKLTRMEQANAAGSHAVRNMPLGSDAPAEGDEVGRLRAALEKCVFYIGSPFRMSTDDAEDARRAKLLNEARTALNRADNAEG